MRWDGKKTRPKGTVQTGPSIYLDEEPAVDLGELIEALDRVALLERGGQDEHALVGRLLELLVRRRLEVGVEAKHVLVDHAQRLLQRLLELAPHGHHLADALHRAANLRFTVPHKGYVDPRNQPQVKPSTLLGCSVLQLPSIKLGKNNIN